jgi:hypothetical protein
MTKVIVGKNTYQARPTRFGYLILKTKFIKVEKSKDYFDYFLSLT